MTDTVEGERIRAAVRQSYGNVARQFVDQPTSAAQASCSCCGPRQPASCCGPSQPAAAGGLASRLYSTDELDGLQNSVTGASLGCGNPAAIADLRPGEVVLDLGSGGGIDCFLAARQVGPQGQVIGLDMTPEMIRLARRNAKELGMSNVDFRFGEIEDIPLPDASVDVIISNCVINLSPDKDAVFREAFRVLRPGGRMMISDMVVDGDLPAAIRERLDVWAGCIAGALPTTEYLDRIRAAGFSSVEVVARERADPGQIGDEGVAQIIAVGADGQVASGPQARSLVQEAGLSLNDLAEMVASIKVKARKPA